MDQLNEQIEQVELSMEAAQKKIDMAKALDELHRNRNFKKVILEGYFEDEAKRLVMLKSDPEMQAPHLQEAVDYEIRAIGGLAQHFRTIFRLGAMAEQALVADRQTHEELLEEAA